jgi:hypothetical protein
MKKPKMSLFVSDRKEVNAFSLNENMLIVDSNKKRPEKKYTDIAGYVNNNKSIRLYWTSGIILKFTHNYTTKKKHSVVNKSRLQLKKEEKFIQNFSENNLLHGHYLKKKPICLSFTYLMPMENARKNN